MSSRPVTVGDLLGWVRPVILPPSTKAWVSPNLRLGRCAKCRATILRGLDDEDAGATLVEITPRALDALGEALAVMRSPNDRTYWIWLTGGRARLVPRDRWSITGDPAGTHRWPVVAVHVCGWVLPGDPRWPEPRRPRRRAVDPDVPPF